MEDELRLVVRVLGRAEAGLGHVPVPVRPQDCPAGALGLLIQARHPGQVDELAEGGEGGLVSELAVVGVAGAVVAVGRHVFGGWTDRRMDCPGGRRFFAWGRDPFDIIPASQSTRLVYYITSFTTRTSYVMWLALKKRAKMATIKVCILRASRVQKKIIIHTRRE